jgi:hypothetical protein
MDEGKIEVDSIELIGFPDISPELARIRISRRFGFAQDSKARQRREDLPRPIPLCTAIAD